MKKNPVLFGLSLFSIVLCAISFSTLTNAQQYPEANFESSEIDSIMVKGFKGRVQVSAGDNPRISVRAFQTKQEGVTSSEWTYRVEKEGRVLKIEAVAPATRSVFSDAFSGDESSVPSFSIAIKTPSKPVEIFWRNGQVEVLDNKAPVFVSQNTGSFLARKIGGNLSVESRSGEVDIDGVEGALNLEKFKGNAKISKVVGRTSVRNFSGNTSIEAAEGSLKFESYGGGLNINKAQGDLDFRTQKGPIRVAGLKGDVNGSSQEGSVHVRVLERPKIRIEAGDADVLLDVPSASGMYLNLGTERGSLQPIGNPSMGSLGNLRVATGEVPGENRGSVYVRTNKGSIRMKRY